MKQYIYDKNNGLWYEQNGEYYIPCLELPEEERKPIGIWGQRHLRYIKQHKRVFYTHLLTSGKLNSYLANLNEDAEEMFAWLVEQMTEREGRTEQLKAENQMEWNAMMNNIRSRVTEIANDDLVYTNRQRRQGNTCRRYCIENYA